MSWNCHLTTACGSVRRISTQRLQERIVIPLRQAVTNYYDDASVPDDTPFRTRVFDLASIEGPEWNGTAFYEENQDA